MPEGALAHWRTHKSPCKLAQFYGRVKDLVVPDEARDFYLAVAQLQIPDVQVTNMAHYLVCVAPSARSLGPGKATLKSSVMEQMLHLGETSTAATYHATYTERVSKSDRDKFETDDAWQVPFDCRPYVAETGGIEHYPQDYAKLPFEMYMFMFGNGLRQSMDPFAAVVIDASKLRVPGPTQW